MSPRLTIAVPTYNRPTVLPRVVERVLAQLTRECRLLVVDNASREPAEDVLHALLNRPWPGEVGIVRNRTNLGMAGNVLKCFELCDTEWLWIVGDDDLVAEGSVAAILEQLDTHPDATFFNFCTVSTQRGRPIGCLGLDDLLLKLDTFNLLLFLSAGVYRASQLLPSLRFGYHYAYSMAPHLGVLFPALGQQGEAWLSDVAVIAEQSVGGLEDRWSHVDACLGMASLAELPMSDEARRRLVQMIARNIPLEAPAYQLLGQLASGEERPTTARFFFDQIWRRIHAYDRTAMAVARYRFYRLLLRVPRWGFQFFKAVKRRRGRLENEMSVPGRYDRTE